VILNIQYGLNTVSSDFLELRESCIKKSLVHYLEKSEELQEGVLNSKFDVTLEPSLKTFLSTKIGPI
jgi:hypothetical protein